MGRSGKSTIFTLAALVGLLAVGPRIEGHARAAEIYAPETLDRYFKLEWSRTGQKVA